MKKFCIAVVCLLFITALPVYSVKMLNTFKWDVPVNVEIVDVSHALQARVKFKDRDFNYPRIAMTVYVSNLYCYEFTKMKIHKSTRKNVSKKSENTGNSYLRPTRYSVKLNTKASEYIKYLFKQYPDDIKLVVHGYGVLNNIVGEFYVNGVNLNNHLIEKGYCIRLR